MIIKERDSPPDFACERTRWRAGSTLVGMTLVFLFFVMLGFFGVKIYKNFNKLSLSKLGKINIIISDSKNFNAIFSTEKNNSFLLTLTPTDRIVLTRGFGEYEIGKIYGLGELEKKGGKLLSESIQEFWSIPILGYVENKFIDEKKLLDNKQGEIKGLVKNCILGKCKTDLQKIDLIILYFNLYKNGRFDNRIEKISSNERQDLWKDKKIREEALAIEVLNSTDHSGLAERGKNLLENAGGRVVRISGLENAVDDCKIIVKQGLIKSYTFNFIKAVYGCGIENLSDENNNRADITLILGKDYWKKLSERW